MKIRFSLLLFFTLVDINHSYCMFAPTKSETECAYWARLNKKFPGFDNALRKAMLDNDVVEVKNYLDNYLDLSLYNSTSSLLCSAGGDVLELLLMYGVKPCQFIPHILFSFNNVVAMELLLRHGFKLTSEIEQLEVSEEMRELFKKHKEELLRKQKIQEDEEKAGFQAVVSSCIVM